MSFIKNLIKEPDAGEKSTNDSANNSDNEEVKPRSIIKSAIDLQRLKLEKLMKNPEKPVVIPEQKREKDFMQSVPTFVRNVMGSSAGAGSGEFHVYRHLRRKEYARQKMIQSKSLQEQLDEEYRDKLKENRRRAEEKTAKKRAKRLKKKNRSKKSKQSENISTVRTRDDDLSNGSSKSTDDFNEKTDVVQTVANTNLEECENQSTNSTDKNIDFHGNINDINCNE